MQLLAFCLKLAFCGIIITTNYESITNIPMLLRALAGCGRRILRSRITWSAFGVAAFGVLMSVSPAYAQVGSAVSLVLSKLAQVIIELVGKLLIVLIEILLAVVEYNDFINAPAVVKAWVLVRDFANMAFLIIFIAIAFATILGVEKYEWKRLLPKLLFMAVAINFSKTICGIVIDAAQVVMMTFVNGFRDVAAGNLVRGFGLNDMLTLRDISPGESGVTDTALASASILAVILLVIATVTIGVMVLMFLVRILYLWILIILAPLAFMLNAAPGFEGKFTDWWGKFVRYAFVGPILAFFLWLSFSIMAAVPPGGNLATENRIPFSRTETEQGTGLLQPVGNTSAAISAIGRSDQLLSYGIAIALLILSLSTANSIGVKGGTLAADALSKIKSGGFKLGKLAGLGVATGGVGVALGAAGAWKGRKWIGRRADDVISPWATKGIGKAGKAIFGETRLGKFFAPIAKEGVRLRDVPKGWEDYKNRRESEKGTRGRGAIQDALMGSLPLKTRKTTIAEQQEAKLVNERAKELADTSTDSDFMKQEFKNALKSKDKIGMKAALLNLVKQNDQNAVLLDPELGTEAARIVRGKMGEEMYKKVYEKEIDGEIKVPDLVADPAHWNEFMRETFGDTSDTGRFGSQLSNIALDKGAVNYWATSKLNPKTGEYRLRDLAHVELLEDTPGNVWRMSEADREKYIQGLIAQQPEDKREKFGLRVRDYFEQSGEVLGKARNFRAGDYQSLHPSTMSFEMVVDGMHTYGDNANPFGVMTSNILSSGAAERNVAGGRSDTAQAQAGHHPSQGPISAEEALANFFWQQGRLNTERIALFKENQIRSTYGLSTFKAEDKPSVSVESMRRLGINLLTPEDQKAFIRQRAREVVEEAGKQSKVLGSKNLTSSDMEKEITGLQESYEELVGSLETMAREGKLGSPEYENLKKGRENIQNRIRELETQRAELLKKEAKSAQAATEDEAEA